mmetsp:Transcript_46344/g.68401  ORF Transcript_46344/g.68401 Transcript_46344/m.68401 type:complete len:204 (-) Transcript_46344:756-1367(-)
MFAKTVSFLLLSCFSHTQGQHSLHLRHQATFHEQAEIVNDVNDLGFGFHGISVSRVVTHVEGGSSFKLGLNHCSSHDEHGDNNCHFNWGDSLEGLFEGNLGTDLVAGDKILGEFKIDMVEDMKISCDVCGQPCIINVPKVGQTIKFDMPSCPITSRKVSQAFKQALPTADAVPVPIRAGGKVKLVKQDGTVLVEADVKARVHK